MKSSSLCSFPGVLQSSLVTKCISMEHYEQAYLQQPEHCKDKATAHAKANSHRSITQLCVMKANRSGPAAL